MTIRRPGKEEFRKLCDEMSIGFEDLDLQRFYQAMIDNLSLYDTLEAYEDPLVEVLPAVRIGSVPHDKADKFNAIARSCSVYLPDVKGILSGKTVGVKDTMAIAGVPLTCGSRLISGFTPDFDATVVRRLLTAGAHITAVTNTDDFASAGAGYTSAFGPTLNPCSTSHVAGGSSCGSGAGVAAGLFDVALGGDQGGSVRIPSAWCGIVGLKPTHGLVPYTGVVGFDQSIDHIGPMARNVHDVALVLEAIAGYDDALGGDPRQRGGEQGQHYRESLGEDIGGVRVAVIKEGLSNCTTDVRESVLEAIESFRRRGAIVDEISVPEHERAVPIWNAVANEGGIQALFSGSCAYQQKGRYFPTLMTELRKSLPSDLNKVSPALKLSIVVEKYMSTSYRGAYYAKAKNLIHSLKKSYDHVLTSYDVVVMPTTPQTAHSLPKDLNDITDCISHGLDMIKNTCVFDLTGHPSITVPCHRIKSLPVGLMISGKYFDESTLLKLAYDYEQHD